jgi:hypothetical protein
MVHQDNDNQWLILGMEYIRCEDNEVARIHPSVSGLTFSGFFFFFFFFPLFRELKVKT